MTIEGEKKDTAVVEMVSCSQCGGNGSRPDGVLCPACEGKGIFLRVRGAADYFWGEEVSGNLSFLRSLGEALGKSMRIAFYLLTVSSIIYGIYFVISSNPDFWENFREDVDSLDFEKSDVMGRMLAASQIFLSSVIEALFAVLDKRGWETLVLWSGVAGAMYSYYISKTVDVAEKRINPRDREFQSFYLENPAKLEGGVDISPFVSPSASQSLKRALDLAHNRVQAPGALHLAKSLIEDADVQRLMARLEIDVKSFGAFLDEAAANLPQNDRYVGKDGTLMSPEMKQIALLALNESLAVGMDMIEPESFFLALFSDAILEKYFHDAKLTLVDVRSAVLWTRSWGTVRVAKGRPRRIRHQVMNRAWTARVTPELDQFSYDMTDYARSGLTGYVVNRTKELDELMRVLERTSKNNALLIGEEGSGRTTIVKALANRMIEDDVLPTLRDKRLVVLDIAALIAGISAEGDMEVRVQKVLEDMGRSGNIILYIPDIHNLTAAGSEAGFDAAKVLSPILSQGLFQIIGSTDYQDYRRYIEPRADFANGFDLVKVEELSEEDALKALAIQAGAIEAREGVKMTYGAVKKAVELSKRYIPDRLLPGKAIDLLSETAVEVRQRGAGSLLRDEDIMKIITEKTGIPLTSINSNEAEKLLQLEENLHRRVIGQDQAIKSVASAIRRVRVGMKMQNRPVGTFLFVGPTGVGKTELAKALSEVYYGDEDAMIRLDMSEYQTVESVEKLIGYSAQDAEAVAGGVLTEAIKHKPFSLLLLDELEKAHKNVLNIFLQVFDDGRLTDNMGRTVDFTNTIIIATSNAGSKEVRKMFIDDMTDNARILEMLEPYLLQYFTPEFLNRFTDKIVFRSLNQQDLLAIARLQIKSLAKRLDEAQGIRVELSEEAVSFLVEAGYNPEYGARFLQRTIQERLENLIAVEFLKGNIKRGDTFRVEADKLRQL